MDDKLIFINRPR